MIISVTDRTVMQTGEPEEVSIKIDNDVDMYNLMVAFSRITLALGYSPENVKEAFGDYIDV